MGHWDKFCLLIWKNWKLQLRKPISFLFQVGVPLLAIALCLFLRYKSDDFKTPTRIYEPLEIEYPYRIEEILNSNYSGYSPSTNAFVRKIMSKYPKMRGFPNSAQLEMFLSENQSPDYFYTDGVGVQFADDLPEDPAKFPKNLNITLRYPKSYSSWYTEELYPGFEIRYGPRQPFYDGGGLPDYHDQNFDGLMTNLTNEVLLEMGKSPIKTRSIQRFPYSGYDANAMVTNLGQINMFGTLFMASFVYSCISIVKSITLEKEKQLKESMKIMGLPTWLHWTAWFVKSFVPFFIDIILITIGFKFNIHGNIFPLTDWSLIFSFLILFVTAMITFCFAISVFFSKANKASTLTGIIWVASMIPFIIIRSTNYTYISPFMKYLSSISIVSAMFYGFDIICYFETKTKGVQWGTSFETTRDNNISFGGILLIMLLDIFIYLIIALYVELIYPGDYGVPQKWYFPFTPSFWFGNKSSTEKILLSSTEQGEYFEDEPKNLRVGIKIKNLGKTFGANEAVKGMSLNLYEDQITVLLGHNGAGKTTTMSMLTGMFPATKGTAIINGFDIRTEIMKVRDSMGLCPQHNVLFDDLTVREHLQFFSRLKGCKGSEVDAEVEKFLDLLSLRDKADAKSSALSGGMKRKLCVGIAICGNSKVIMLDEPTAGMDPSARRFIWEFLQKMKKGRTILLTTHFMDEADLLGDRIAIMSGGELKCCGSSFFLKKKYGTGYHLILDQLPRCQPDRITEMLNKYIPTLQIESNAGTELTYLLPENYASKFPEMLSEMESRLQDLKIRSFGISLTDLEEVFMKVGTNETGRTILKHDDEVEGYTNVTINSRIPLETGFRLHLNQIHAMFLKKFISFIRTWGMELLKIALPILFILLMNYADSKTLDTVSHPSRAFTLDDYDDPITLVQISPNKEHESYIELLKKYNHKYELTDSIIRTVLNLTKTNEDLMKYKYIVGASFDREPIAWFSNEPYHTVPLSIQLLMNMYVDKETNGAHQMNFINYPLPEKNTETDLEVNRVLTSMTAMLALSLAADYIGAFYILFIIRERVSQAKHLQYISGINIWIFWGISFITDLITYLIPAAAIVICYAILKPSGLTTASSLCALAFVLFNFGIAILAFVYLFSYRYTTPSTGYSKLFFLGFFAGAPTILFLLILTAVAEDWSKILKWIFRLFPHYDFIDAVNNIIKKDHCDDFFNQCPENFKDICIKSVCEQIEKYNDTTITNRECCVGYLSFDELGLGRSVLFSYLIATICFTVIFLIDFKKFSSCRQSILSSSPNPIQNVDADVQMENQKVLNSPLSQLQLQYALVLKQLTKMYKDFMAVNGLNLTVEKSECFGLLGVNGAGKTTTFKMMTGDETISFGDGWVDGFSIKNQMKEVQRLIGYCPQFDALLDNLTARETLKIFSLIRGIPRDECDYTVEKLARDFDFTQHLDKQVRELSGGNKRKLSTAIALIGDSPIIFLDEPTTGMDPATKRHLWNRLSKIRESGKSIILTSHSMEECEALCTRLAIMVNGNFQCLGSIQHLKSRFAEGFSITLKIRKLENSSGSEHAETTHIEHFMAQHFPNSQLLEKHQELLNYYIKDRNAKWSNLFGILERAKRELNIEDYSVGQASLEQVFLTFTRNQVVQEETKDKSGKCMVGLYKCCCCCC